VARVSKLQQEIRQTRPFRSLGQEAYLNILKTADVLRRLTAAVLAPYGITQQQYNVLRILRGAGDEGMPTLDIAGRLIEEAPGITRMLDRLEARGWVRRERCASDRRQVFAYITGPGRDLLAQIDPAIDRPVTDPFAGFERQELEELIGTLESVRSAAGS
jgi:DNA-binding MarR family transcriptional regulator